jgi:hypothetical protein
VIDETLGGEDDPPVLNAATVEGRILLTFDLDLLILDLKTSRRPWRDAGRVVEGPRRPDEQIQRLGRGIRLVHTPDREEDDRGGIFQSSRGVRKIINSGPSRHLSNTGIAMTTVFLGRRFLAHLEDLP